MKKISDIRIFKSLKPNVDRAPLPVGLASKQLFTTVRRIVLKLRENQFSLGDFDHLYLNFTTRVEEGEIVLSSRTAPGGNNFFRFYDIGVSREQFDILEEPDQIPFILGKLEETMVRFFGDDGRDEIIRGSIRAAVEQGEEMQMVYKKKEAQGRTAVLSLRFLDSGEYFPLLCVYDKEDNLLLQKDLDPMRDLSTLGEIRLTGKRISIYPRQTAKAKTFRPLTFEF